MIFISNQKHIYLLSCRCTRLYLWDLRQVVQTQESFRGAQTNTHGRDAVTVSSQKELIHMAIFNECHVTLDVVTYKESVFSWTCSYRCEICGYQCRQRASLNWHMRKHTSEAHFNYTCEHCGKRFEKLDSVKFHKLKSHPDKQSTWRTLKERGKTHSYVQRIYKGCWTQCFFSSTCICALLGELFVKIRTCLINNQIEDKWTGKTQRHWSRESKLFVFFSVKSAFLIPVLDTGKQNYFCWHCMNKHVNVYICFLLIPYLKHTIRVI